MGRGQRGRLIGRSNFERIGETNAQALLVDSNGTETTMAVAISDHGEATRRAVAWLDKLTGQTSLQVDAGRIESFTVDLACSGQLCLTTQR